MNEVMQALETMIRRIVREELGNVPAIVDDRDFDRGFERYVDGNKARWSAVVSQGALDQPWFDDAIAAEVAVAATPEPAAFLATWTKDDLTHAVNKGTFSNIMNSATIHDHIVQIVQDTSSDLRHDFVEEVIRGYDFSEIVADGIEDYDFTNIVQSAIDVEDAVKEAVNNLTFSVSVD